MDEVSIIGIDLAKRSFQLHGARADGSVMFRKTLRRGKVLAFLASQPRCVVAMEACASAHYRGREIMRLGHEVRLIPPIYVKPFVKRQKNDTKDAEAICEAGLRPTMRFVAVKGEEQQARAMLFRTRDLLVRQRTQTINALRGHLAEFGVIAPQGVAHVRRLASAVEDAGSPLPARARLLRLVGPCAAPALDRRQAEARQYLEDGPTRSQAPLDHRCHGCRQIGGSSRRDEGPLAGPDAGAQAADACGGGAGQPDGAHRLGIDGEEGGLPGFRRRLSGRQEGGSPRRCGQVGRRVRANGR